MCVLGARASPPACGDCASLALPIRSPRGVPARMRSLRADGE